MSVWNCIYLWSQPGWSQGHSWRSSQPTDSHLCLPSENVRLQTLPRAEPVYFAHISGCSYKAELTRTVPLRYPGDSWLTEPGSSAEYILLYRDHASPLYSWLLFFWWLLFIIRVSLHLICQHRFSVDAGTSGGSRLGGDVRVVCHPRSFHHTWALMERPTFLFPSLSIKPSASAHGVSSYIYTMQGHIYSVVYLERLYVRIVLWNDLIKRVFFLP